MEEEEASILNVTDVKQSREVGFVEIGERRDAIHTNSRICQMQVLRSPSLSTMTRLTLAAPE